MCVCVCCLCDTRQKEKPCEIQLKSILNKMVSFKFNYLIWNKVKWMKWNVCDSKKKKKKVWCVCVCVFCIFTFSVSEKKANKIKYIFVMTSNKLISFILFALLFCSVNSSKSDGRISIINNFWRKSNYQIIYIYSIFLRMLLLQ